MTAKLAREMTHRTSRGQGQSIEDIERGGLQALRRGVQSWVPDMAALPFDIVDALAYAGRRAAGRRNPPSLGAGEAVRASLKRRMGFTPPEATQAEMRPTEDEAGITSALRFANPLAFVNPTTLVRNPAGLAAIAGLSGDLGSALGGLGALGVVKPKGGNWLTGSVEDALKGLKREAIGSDQRVRAKAAEDALANEQMRGAMSPEYLARLESEARRLRGEGNLNDWIEGPLTKYVKTRMASPDDEVRKLAEEGVLHFEPAMIRERSPLMEKVVGRRETAGFPIEGLGDSPLARSWENTSDSSLRNLTALDLSEAERASTFGGKTVPKDTVVHEMNPFASGAGISDLGFPHLIDELSNALNPASGLPRHLQLTPEAVKNMSMEKAVRRVADINAWRAAQKAEANRKLAEQASVVREYPHSEATPNPKGLRWVELKAPQTVAENATEADYVAAKAGRKQLEDQLKYEGDTMDHCVGDYCDGVLSGRQRIFSLRDAKGEPHVTVEVTPAAEADANVFTKWADKNPEDFNRLFAENGRNIVKTSAAWRELHAPELMPSISQIKGKQNRAPNEEYLPFVQDFVRNNPLGGQWADVGDLQNTGLRKIGNKWLTEQEHKAILERRLPDGRPILDQDGVDAMEAMQRIIDDADPDRFAQGGLVNSAPPPPRKQPIMHPYFA